MTRRTRRQDRRLDTFLEKEWNRRRMIGASLKAGLGGLFAAHLGPGVIGCATGGDDDSAGDDDDAGDDDTSGESYLVGIGGGGDALEAIAAALPLAGGLGFVAGKSVFLKLAANQSDAYPFSTNPAVLEWIVAKLQEAGAASISCGDSPFYGDYGDVFGDNGLTAAAAASGIELHDFREGGDWVTIPGAEAPHWPAGLRLPAVMTEADHIINLPVLKTHFITGATLALKLQIGATRPADREENLGYHHEVDVQIAEINAHLTPSLSITDGYMACINGGPSENHPGTEQAEVGLAIVSTDRIAHDVVGTAILRQYTSEQGLLDLASPWALRTIEESIALDLGIGGPGDLTVGFAGVGDAMQQAILDDVG